MNWSGLLGRLVALGVALWAVGAAFSLGANTFMGDFSLAAAAVVGLLVVSLLVAVKVGARSAEWLANPDTYW